MNVRKLNKKVMKDKLGDRMKGYYESRTQTHLPRRTYTIIRLDGKAFHTYTKKLNKPFDAKLMDDMFWTARGLCGAIQGCKLGYTQSDEISLLLTDFDNLETDAWFDGNVQKMVSVSAAMASSVFNSRREPDKFGNEQKLAFFDARVFTIPTKVEVENYFIWRQKDWIRNSISLVAQSHFSPKELHGKSIKDRLKMLEEIGDLWESYDEWERMGCLITKGDGGFVYNSRVGTFDFVNEREKFNKHIPENN